MILGNSLSMEIEKKNKENELFMNMFFRHDPGALKKRRNPMYHECTPNLRRSYYFMTL